MSESVCKYCNNSIIQSNTMKWFHVQKLDGLPFSYIKYCYNVSSNILFDADFTATPQDPIPDIVLVED